MMCAHIYPMVLVSGSLQSSQSLPQASAQLESENFESNFKFLELFRLPLWKLRNLSHSTHFLDRKKYKVINDLNSLVV